MRYIILFLLIQPIIFCYGQFPNDDGAIKSRHIRKIITTAREYNNGDVIKLKTYITEFDESGNEVSSISYDNGKMKSFTLKNYYDNGMKTVENSFNGDSSLIHSLVHITDTTNKTKYFYQISGKGDTLVFQKRYLNKFGKDSILYTKTSMSPQFKITARWDYDDSGNLLSQNLSNSVTTTIKESDCIITYNANKIMIYKTCVSKNKETTYFYQDKTGYLYGITTHSKSGGQRIQTKNKAGLVTEISYLNEQGKVLSNIVFEYQK